MKSVLPWLNENLAFNVHFYLRGGHVCSLGLQCCLQAEMCGGWEEREEGEMVPLFLGDVAKRIKV